MRLDAAARHAFQRARCQFELRWRPLRSPLRNRATCPSTALATFSRDWLPAIPLSRAVRGSMAVPFPDRREMVECTSTLADRGDSGWKSVQQGTGARTVRRRFWRLQERCELRSAPAVYPLGPFLHERDPGAAPARNRRRNRRCEKIAPLSRPYCFASARSSASVQADLLWQPASLPTPAHDFHRNG